MMKRTFFLAIVTVAFASSNCARADHFGSGANAFTIDFVTIGSPGNPADTTGSPNPAGSVAYSYRIGKYEISRAMVDAANAEGGLGLTLADMTFYGGNGPNRPATGLTWFEAAKFVNWLNTSTGATPAYKFDGSSNFELWAPVDPGYDASNLFRNSLAKYFLPSADEWYKAAYYDSAAGVYWNFATGSNIPPLAVASGTTANSAVYNQIFTNGPADIMNAGGLSSYGTMAQDGNVQEREETEFDLMNDSTVAERGRRGGMWEVTSMLLGPNGRFSSPPDAGGGGTGFRISSVVPEPSCLTMSVAFLAAHSVLRRLSTLRAKTL